jgi:hypothetical protein
VGGASNAIPNFLGGEISQFSQGRFDKPDYRVSLNVCVNSFPVEIGPWVRRPGFMYAGHTRGGAAAKVIKFDFQQAAAITTEFTNGFVRFRNGTALLTTNDAQTVLAVSAANPAVVQTSGLHGWTTGNTVTFPAPGPSPLLEGRQFIATVTDTTHFSLTDALTGATIDGSTLGAITAGTFVARVQELVTPYAGGSWASIRAVQAETTDLLLNGAIAPQALTVPTLPAGGNSAIFAITPANFLDGPYLDQVNGSLVTPSGVSGVITLTLSAQVYSAATAYKTGDLVTSGTITYVSLQDANFNNTPASSPTFWQITSPGQAVGPNGFQSSDAGRMVRLFNASLGSAWSAVTTYGAGELASVSGIGYRSLVGGNLNNTPSANSSWWQVYTPGWTWGKITGLSTIGFISPGGFPTIGNMTSGGGLAAAFDGVLSKVLASTCSLQHLNGPDGLNHVYNDYVGLNFTGTPKAISSVVLYPSSDHQFEFVNNQRAVYPTSFYLRAKATAPASSSDGTVIGFLALDAVNTGIPVTLISSDQTTTWNYVWIEVVSSVTAGPPPPLTLTVTPNFSQVRFFGTGGVTGTIVSVAILGAPLPNTQTIPWLLGAYSVTSGYPTCGCYHEGRIWLGGAIPNRFDAGVSNGISGSTLNFAPTDNTGQVLASSAISYKLNSDSVNPIFWFQPDLQGIIIGTQAGEWLVQAPTSGPITAINIAARRVTKIGCANIEPRRTEHTNVFVQRYGQKLMEYFADVYSGKFSAPNIADKAQHITHIGIAELAYAQAVTPIIWGRDTTGKLFGVTYKRDTLTTAQGPTFAAWHRHTLGSGRVVESICSGPSTGGNLDALTIVSNDPVTNIRHVEVMTDTLDEISALTTAWFLDDSVAPTSTSTTNVPAGGSPYGGMTINGLWHLNGKTVQIFAGGLDLGYRGPGTVGFTDFVVTNGSIFIPYGDSISAGVGAGLFTADYVASLTPFPIAIGFTYTSQGQLVRSILPADTGNRNGLALGLIRRIHRYAVLLNNSFGISFGTTFSKLAPAAYGSPTQLKSTFTGIATDGVMDDYTYEGMFCWQVSRPYPANVIAISVNLTTQEQ